MQYIVFNAQKWNFNWLLEMWQFKLFFRPASNISNYCIYEFRSLYLLKTEVERVSYVWYKLSFNQYMKLSVFILPVVITDS